MIPTLKMESGHFDLSPVWNSLPGLLGQSRQKLFGRSLNSLARTDPQKPERQKMEISKKIIQEQKQILTSADTFRHCEAFLL